MLRGVNGPATVVLGVDIGTTSAKAVAFDADGRELGRGETGYPLLEPEHGQAVQDPAAVVEGTLAAIRAAAAGARDQGAADRGAVVQRRPALAGRPRRAGQGAHAARDVGRHAGDRAGRAPARRAPRAARPDGHAAAPDVAAAQARVVRRARARDLRRRPALGGDQGARGRPADRHVGGRPLGRLGHGPAQPASARLGPRGARDRGHRRRRAVAARARPRIGWSWRRRPPPTSGSRPGWRSSSAPPTGRWPTSASARCAPAWPPARSAPAARCG